MTSREHLLALLEVEQRLRLLRVAAHGDDDVVEVTGGALDDVEVAVGHRVERARAEGGCQRRLLSRWDAAGQEALRGRRRAYRRMCAPSGSEPSAAARSRGARRALDDHEASGVEQARRRRAQRGPRRRPVADVVRRVGEHELERRFRRHAAPARNAATSAAHDPRDVVEAERGEVLLDRGDGAPDPTRRTPRCRAPRQRLDAERAASPRTGRARRRRRRAPRAASAENTASRTMSLVGRTSSPGGTVKRRPRALPR